MLALRAQLYALIRAILRRARRSRSRDADAVDGGKHRTEHRELQHAVFAAASMPGRPNAGCAPRPSFRSSACSPKASGIATNWAGCSAMAKPVAGTIPNSRMLEWYRVGWDHRRLIDETIELVRAACSFGRTHARCSVDDLSRMVPRCACRSIRSLRRSRPCASRCDDVRIDGNGLAARRLARSADHPSPAAAVCRPTGSP